MYPSVESFHLTFPLLSPFQEDKMFVSKSSLTQRVCYGVDVGSKMRLAKHRTKIYSHGVMERGNPEHLAKLKESVEAWNE
jgi:hypothetical protein